VGRLQAARRRAGGGEHVTAPRPRRPRLATAAGSVAVAAALAGWTAVSVAEREPVAWAALGVGAFGLVLLGVGVAARVPAGITAGLAIVGGAYGATLVVESAPLDRQAPIAAAALVLAAELAWWSLELRARIAPEAGSYLRALAVVLTLALGAYGLGALLLAAVDVARTSGLAIEAAGAAGAAAALAVALLAGRTRA
jgi:hypothetical protein